MNGQIRTVTGDIEPQSLGRTLTHEHLFVDSSHVFSEHPETATERKYADEDITLENLWFARQHPFDIADNLRLTSITEAIHGMTRFRSVGGNAIVDVTARNLFPDPVQSRRVSQQTGVKIIHGTAFYTAASHSTKIRNYSSDEIADIFESDIQNGIKDTDVPAGIIGEIGLSERIHDSEATVLRGAAKASLRTGAPISVHPPGRTQYSRQAETYPTSRWGLNVLDILEEEGVPPDRVVICHLDRSIREDIRHQKALADRGAFVEYDLWGQSRYTASREDGYPSDHQRASMIKALIDAGHSANIVFAQDTALKIQRREYGGKGYTYVMESVPEILRQHTISDEQIEQILISNPQRLLTFDSS